MLWGNIKGQELANRCADDLAEVDMAIRSGMGRVRRSSQLPFSFLKHAGLSFDSGITGLSFTRGEEGWQWRWGANSKISYYAVLSSSGVSFNQLKLMR